ncbi:MAG: serine/threonine-protein kinase [Planctomycetota bacterium]
MAAESTNEDAISNAPGPGTAIDRRFEVVAELGAGQSGTVYRARVREAHDGLAAGSAVAIKVLRPELRNDPEAQKRLVEEGRLGLSLQSPHLVKIHSADPEAAALVMELVAGQSLREFLEQSRSAVEELARRIGRDAARGLAALHRLGVVHRDIKPENLALTDAGQVKVMDLGLARRIRRRPQAKGAFSGSLSYAAPEVLRGRPATPKSDLYSLGVVLFEVATGRHPFAPIPGESGDEAKTEADAQMAVDDLIHAHIHEPPPRPSHHKPRISALLEQVILDLLAKDPAARPASAAEVAAALEHGERSRYWLRHERSAPTLASRRRLRAMMRPAQVPFVGRRPELAQLNQLLRAAIEGRGAAVQISGPRGIGRRRLLDHFLEPWLARRQDLLFLGSQAEQGRGLQRTTAFSRMVLDWFLGGEQEDSPNAQTRLAARIQAGTELSEQEAQRVAAMACAQDLGTGPEERADLVVRVLLSLASRDQTLVLRIDRAEQLSTTAQLVMARLMDHIKSRRILLLLTSLRPEPPAAGFVTIPLRNLSESEFVALGESLFQRHKAPTELLTRAHTTLAGVPRNLLDALADLRAHGKLAGRAGSYVLAADVRELPAPGTLLDLLQRRIHELTPDQRHVHVAAAILGQQFSIQDLAALAGRTELATLTGLSVFEGRVIFTQRGHGTFRHRDFRRAILDLVPAEARRRLHRAAAWVLEDRGAPPLEVGMHYSRASEHAAAIEPLLAGLAELVARGSRGHSHRIANRLSIHLDALPPSDSTVEQGLRYLLLRGQVELSDHNEAEAHTTFRRAACLAMVRGAHGDRARALIELGAVALAGGRLHEALRRLDQAEGLLRRSAEQTEDHAPLLARCLSLRGRVLGYLGQSEEALFLVQQALRTVIARVPATEPETPAEQQELLAHLHVDLARLEVLRNHPSAALKSLDRAEGLFAARGSAQGMLRVTLHRGHLHAVLGDKERATRLLEAAMERGRQLSDLRAQGKAMLFLGEQALLWGDRRRATSQLFDAVTLATRPGDHVTRVLACLYLQQLEVKTDDLEAEVSKLGLPALEVLLLLNQAADCRREGNEQERRDLLAKAVRVEREVTVPLHLHHRLLLALGKHKHARRLVEEIAARLSGALRRRCVSLMRRAR